jgi:competence protein ComEA
VETAPDDDDRRPAPRPAFPPLLAETVVPWLRFVGMPRLLGGLGMVLLLAGVAWWMLRSPAAPTESRLPLADRAAVASDVAGTTSSSRPSPAPTTVDVIIVHVTGAVHAPGVYELVAGQRVADAIIAAGGSLAGADADALNLAAPVADGDRIAVPNAGEAGAGSAGHSHAAPPTHGEGAADPVDVNTATAAELETLPGIGPATAAAIVEHRARNGPFASVDELEAVPGIGTAKLDAVRALVRL